MVYGYVPSPDHVDSAAEPSAGFCEHHEKTTGS